MVYLILVTQDMCQSTVTKNGRPKTLSLPMSSSFPPALRAQREPHPPPFVCILQRDGTSSSIISFLLTPGGEPLT